MSVNGAKTERFDLVLTDGDIDLFMLLMGKVLDHSKKPGFKRDFQQFRELVENIILILHREYGTEE